MRFTWFFVVAALAAALFANHLIVPSKANLTASILLGNLPAPEVVKQDKRDALIAKVFSTYPFNHRNIITINAGSADGVRVGLAVTAEGNYLIGQVSEVSEHSSQVRTIFDKDWSLSVRVGQKEVNALLVNGQEPRLTMIEKQSELNEKDQVHSASRDFPYGLKVGAVGAIQDSGIVSFKQALLEVPYQIGDLREVAVLLN